MIFIGEICSLFKNCGLLAYIFYLCGVTKSNPYTSDSFMEILEKKGVVDSMAEVLSCVAVGIVYSMEKQVRGWDGVNMFNVTVPFANGTSYHFVTEGCGVTCFGWTINDGIPPPSPESIRSGWTIFGVLALIAVVRVLFLLVERIALDLISRRFKKSSSEKNEENGQSQTERVENKLSATVSSRLRSLSKQTSNVTDSAKAVFEDVSPIVLFAIIVMSLTSCMYSFQELIAFRPVKEGVSFEVVRD